MSDDTYLHRLHRSPAVDAPLVFLFHGTGGDENQFFDLGRHLLPEAHLVSPRGDVSESGAARFFRRTGEGRYDLVDLARATAKMVRFVGGRIADLSPSRVFGLGYSNGANILASVLIEERGGFDAGVLMHPLIPFEPQAASSLEGLSLLVTAGEQDPICPPALTRRLAGHFERRGAAVSTHWHPGGHDIRQDELAAAAKFLGRCNLVW